MGKSRRADRDRAVSKAYVNVPSGATWQPLSLAWCFAGYTAAAKRCKKWQANIIEELGFNPGTN